ncbi:hypothetical protein [Psychroserpens ponticola]|uniref:Polysaccharide chain length determinant N-terminal domain-containing protein n=1 Tax=Psychroserpens ponticola TaxID=2932268 RepID=A0ABY7RY92_9FLAO|nr:hypothetical protein [Psychroserpens ponticola]WCO01656.1 hypothetical protein MUN68_016535 [Psychroserpens ponticola]
MSKDLQNQNNNNEEVDLLVLFNYLGDKINNLVTLVKKLVIGLFSIFIYASRAVFNNIKLIALVMVLAGVLGYVLQKANPKVYESSMLVRTYFDAKYQLATNINYYNALLGDQDYDEMASIFEIDQKAVSEILRFEMSVGPETENDRIIEYDAFLKSIDSTRASEIIFEDFVENRDIYTGNLFEIRVESHKKNIFKRLETGINNSFENRYSTKKMEKRDSMIVIKRKSLQDAINQIDSLKRVYIKVMQNESVSPKANISLGEGFPLMQEKSQTKEFQLLDKEIKLKAELRVLDEQKLEENVFFDVISSFQVVGNEVKHWQDRYALIFPVLAFILLCLGYLIKKFAIYVKNYSA